MKTTVLAICAASLATGTVGAEPLVVTRERTPDPAVQMEKVTFADLNIGSESGLKSLKNRIRRAADRVCVNGNTDPLASKIESMGCHRSAVAGGFAQLDRILAARQPGTALATAAITVSGR